MTAMTVRHAKRRNLPAVSRRCIAGHTICPRIAECGSLCMSKAMRVTCCGTPPFQESQQGLPTTLTLRIHRCLLFEWPVMSVIKSIQCKCDAGKVQADAYSQRLGGASATLHMHKTFSSACDIGDLPVISEMLEAKIAIENLEMSLSCCES